MTTSIHPRSPEEKIRTLSAYARCVMYEQLLEVWKCLKRGMLPILFKFMLKASTVIMKIAGREGPLAWRPEKI